MKKVLLVIAHDGYQPVEYGDPKRVLEGAGIQVVTASDQLGTATAAYNGSSAQVDITIADVNVADYDGIFFMGGPGAKQYLENENVYALVRAFADAGKFFGAICYSPRILAHAGVLKDKKATGWDGDDKLSGILSGAGANYVRAEVVADGKLITATGPQVAKEWGEKILEII